MTAPDVAARVTASEAPWCGNCGHSLHGSGPCPEVGVHPHGPNREPTEFRCRCSHVFHPRRLTAVGGAS